MSYERVRFNPNHPDIVAAREKCLSNIKHFKFAPATNMWAYALLTRHGNGEDIPPDSLRMAREATR